MDVAAGVGVDAHLECPGKGCGRFAIDLDPEALPLQRGSHLRMKPRGPCESEVDRLFGLGWEWANKQQTEEDGESDHCDSHGQTTFFQVR
jgi:hypothetical protein